MRKNYKVYRKVDRLDIIKPFLDVDDWNNLLIISSIYQSISYNPNRFNQSLYRPTYFDIRISTIKIYN